MWEGAVLLVLVAGSLFVANAVAGVMQLLRSRRIQSKVEALSRSPAVDNRIPVTLITGFLGSGKTLLLNKLLGDAGGRRICVIENEAGAVSIDHSLLRLNTANKDSLAGLVVLKNGCMCCSAKGSGDELERVLDKLLQLSPEIAERQIDSLVIECSGLVDPAPLISTLMRPEVMQTFQLDAVVAVVDAKHVKNHFVNGGFLSRQVEAGRQVAYADIVLLNKMDLASSQEAAAAEAAVRQVNPTASIQRCAYAELLPSAASVILDRRVYDPERTRRLLDEDQGRISTDAASASSTRGAVDCPGCGDTNHGHHRTAPMSGSHSAGVNSVTIDLGDTVVSEAALRSWLIQLVSRKPTDLFRIKGLLRVTGGPGAFSGVRLCVVHGVHGELHTSILDADLSSGEAAAQLGPSAIVLIGRSLDAAELQASFRASVPAVALTGVEPGATRGTAGVHVGHQAPSALSEQPKRRRRGKSRA